MATAEGSAEPVTMLRRRQREREIVAATRRLFDQRGMQDAPMEEIAREVGIARTLIYREFGSKEELFVLAVTSYLDEITAQGVDRLRVGGSPTEQLRTSWESFAGYCLAHPAFLDCAVSLMRRPAAELRDRVSSATWFRLGQSMSRCLAVTVDIVGHGVASGEFTAGDPALVVNCLYAQTLGTMHLARVGVGVREAAPGIPEMFAVDAADVVESCVRAALAAVGTT